MSQIQEKTVTTNVDKNEQAKADKQAAESAKNAAISLREYMQAKPSEPDSIGLSVFKALAGYYKASLSGKGIEAKRRLMAEKMAKVVKGDDPIWTDGPTLQELLTEQLEAVATAYGDNHKGTTCKGGQSSAEYGDVVLSISETRTEAKKRLINSPIG